MHKAKEEVDLFIPEKSKFNFWDNFAEQKIDSVFVPGSHHTMYDERNAIFLAYMVDKKLGFKK